MQKYTSLYGLTIDCSDEQHLIHQDLQAVLSEAFNEATHTINKKGYNGVCANFARINDNDQYLTAFTKYGQLQLGIYDNKSKTISSSCMLDDIKCLTTPDIYHMSMMIQNYAKNNITMEYDSHVLLSAWGHEMVRRRMAEKSTPSQTLKSSIFTKSFAEIAKDVSERHRHQSYSRNQRQTIIHDAER